MLDDLVTRVDAAIGNTVERQILRHHKRRLERNGWGAALLGGETLWAEGEPPPRPGNDVEVLIDGASALPRIVDAIEGARSHVHVAGWFLSLDFALRRDGFPLQLRELLAETARRVDTRVLLWAGAPLPLFKPSRATVRNLRDGIERLGVRCALDDRERPMHCHHEKLVIVDDEVAFVGGIDLTEFTGDRYDSNDHPFRAALGWHDAAAELRGPAVGDVADHFALRWSEVTEERLATARPEPAGEHAVQIVQTIPEKIYAARRRGVFRILESYVRALRAAERLIYLESQFLWSPELVAILVDKLERPPREDFRLVVVLPADPQHGEEDTRGQLGILADADRGRGRLLACALHARDDGRSCPVYVHAKIGIVDDRWLTLGSANLNDHSLFNDTEVNLVTCGGLARETRERLWAEHLEVSLGEVRGHDPVELVDRRWKPIAHEQLARKKRGDALTHRLVHLPHVSRRARGMLGPLQNLVVDG
jgi:phosphatidylserine/phosphatidylglycerophosphate/cardiolipin synthase-like enzyme